VAVATTKYAYREKIHNPMISYVDCVDGPTCADSIDVNVSDGLQKEVTMTFRLQEMPCRVELKPL
jgi:VCBS repeat-containing protein